MTSLFLAGTVLCGARLDGAAEPSPAVLITHVAVVEASGALSEDQAVLIRGNRISARGPATELAAPEDATIYDAGGRFLIPGLWDMHTHVLWQPFVQDGYLRLFLVNGVTGIRDMGGTLSVVQAVRPGGTLDSPLNPRIVAAGPWLNRVELDPRSGMSVQSPEAARRAVASLAEAGVDFIKVYLQLTRDVFLAILDEAEKRHLPVVGHVPLDVGSKEASDLGMHSIEHMRVEVGGYCPQSEECDELFAAFRRNRTWQTPVLLVRRNRADLDQSRVTENPDLGFAPDYLRREWEQLRQRRLQTVSFDELRERYAAESALAGSLLRARVPMLAGSDAGDLYSLPGFSIHEELALLVDAGFSPAEALRAATVAPAEYLGQTDSMGSVDVGKAADLVLLDANPLADIRNTRTIHAVVRDGRIYDRKDLDRLLDQIPKHQGRRD